MDFVLSLVTYAGIFGILAFGFKFFIQLKQTIDFSYVGIVIFGAYCSTILNVYFGWGILASFLGSFLLSIVFSILILYLSSKLSSVFFAVGTLALYMLLWQIAKNLDITGGSRGLSIISKNVFGDITVYEVIPFLAVVGVIVGVIILALWAFKKTYFYKILIGWGENNDVLLSLGVRTGIYKFVMIVVTSLLAVMGGTLLAFHLLFIDPNTFWLTLLIPLLSISLVSYKLWDLTTFGVSILVIGLYESLRFWKVVELTQVGYFREMVFAIVIMVASYVIFRKINFGREF